MKEQRVNSLNSGLLDFKRRARLGRLGVMSIVAILFGGCATKQPPSSQQNRSSERHTPSTAGREDDRITTLLRKMTLEEKIGQLSQLGMDGAWDAQAKTWRMDDAVLDAIKKGKTGSILFFKDGTELIPRLQALAVKESRLGIPLLFAQDVLHGYRTVFPVPLAEASSWHPELIRKAAAISANEAASAGIHWTYAPMVDVGRDARWGRIVEGAGEDPYLSAVVAQARVQGFQGGSLAAPDTMAACAKHFAAYGAAEGGRDYNTADLSRRTLLDVYLPPFNVAVNSGVQSIMIAHNEISGIPVLVNKRLITGLLRQQWGFNGVVISDLMSIDHLIRHGVAASGRDAAIQAIRAGVDVDMGSGLYVRHLPEAVAQGLVSEAAIDDATLRVLRLKQALGLFDDPFRYIDETRQRERTLTAEHRRMAREMGQQSIVLLKNENATLPLKKNISRIAVIGPFAKDAAASLGPWAPMGKPDDVVTLVAALQEQVTAPRSVRYLKGSKITGPKRPRMIQSATRLARNSDVVILVLGEDAEMSGEAASRSSFELPEVQRNLAAAVLGTNTPVVTVIVAGRPIGLTEIANLSASVLYAWHLGVEAGPALASILLGRTAPGGKLPISFPRRAGEGPLYYNYKPTGLPADDKNKYTSKYADTPVGALYPFGHGLTYSEFKYSNLKLAPMRIGARGGMIDVSFEVQNVGPRRGDEVVQLYVRDPVASVTRPVKELKGFKRLTLESGRTVQVTFTVPVDILGFHDHSFRYVVEPGSIQIMVGSSSEDIRLTGQVDISGETAVFRNQPVRFSNSTVHYDS